MSKSNLEKTYPWIKHYPQDIHWDADIAVGFLPDLLDQAIKNFPAHPFINFLEKKYTYQEIGDLVNRMAKGLQELGLKKGAKIGIFMPNTPYYVIAYFAILKIGGTVVNFNPLYATREITGQIKDSKVEIIVTLDLEALYPKILAQFTETSLQKIIVCPLADCLPFPKNILFPLFKAKEIAKIRWDANHISFKDLTNNDGLFTAVEVNPKKDMAVLQYTGGTTGSPKGVMLSHANLYANTEQIRMWALGLEMGHEKILAALPFFHIFAMTAVMNLGIILGAEIIMMFPRFDLKEAMGLIVKHKITIFPAVPTIYTMINSHPKVTRFNLSSLKVCVSGGAPLSVEVKKRFEQLTGSKLVEGYGLSEASPILTCNPLFGLYKVGSVGVPFPKTIVKIVSLEDPGKEMAPGEKGQVAAKGPQVTLGYWNRPSETKDSFSNKFLLTGDVGYMDEEGYVFLVDRIKDVIICNGYNIYPRNVEEAIYLHSSVEEVTVVGVPDKKRGEVAKAFVKLQERQSLTSDELLDFLKDKLSPLELPKYIEFRQYLPKTMIGKLSKKELKEEENKKR